MVEPTKVSPLAWNVPIVDEKGNPTPYFVRQLEVLLAEKAATEVLVEGATPMARILTAGAGLTGGGDLSADRTFDVGAGTGITVNANDVAINTTDEAERVRDTVAAFAVAGTNMTITHNDGADTLTFDATGGSGSSWTLAGSSTIGSPVANVDFTGLAGASDIMVVFRNVTFASNDQPALRCSVNNGSSYYAASGDYVAVPTTGIEANLTSVALHNTAATAARSAIGLILAANVNGAIKVIDRMNRDDGGSALFIASTSPVNAIRCLGSAAANLTGGSIYLYTR